MALEPLKLGDNRGEHITALITAVDELRKMVEDQNRLLLLIMEPGSRRWQTEYKPIKDEILGHMDVVREQLDLLR